MADRTVSSRFLLQGRREWLFRRMSRGRPAFIPELFNRASELPLEALGRTGRGRLRLCILACGGCGWSLVTIRPPGVSIPLPTPDRWVKFLPRFPRTSGALPFFQAVIFFHFSLEPKKALWKALFDHSYAVSRSTSAGIRLRLISFRSTFRLALSMSMPTMWPAAS